MLKINRHNLYSVYTVTQLEDGGEHYEFTSTWLSIAYVEQHLRILCNNNPDPYTFAVMSEATETEVTRYIYDGNNHLTEWGVHDQEEHDPLKD